MREVFIEDEIYRICPMIDEDRELYVELQRQIIGEHTLFLNSAVKDKMWETTLNSDDSQEFSIFDVDNNYCGNLCLQNKKSKTPEIGIDLREDCRNIGIAPRVIKMFARQYFLKNEIDYFVIRIASNNSHSKHVFEKLGVIPEEKEKTPFEVLMERFNDIAQKNGDDLSQLKKYFSEHDAEWVDRYRYESSSFM